MGNAVITTEGIYTRGVVVPRVKPEGRRRALVTFLPQGIGKRFRSDEEAWREMEPTARRVRKELFRKNYPSLYARSGKKT